MWQIWCWWSWWWGKIKGWMAIFLNRKWKLSCQWWMTWWWREWKKDLVSLVIRSWAERWWEGGTEDVLGQSQRLRIRRRVWRTLTCLHDWVMEIFSCSVIICNGWISRIIILTPTLHPAATILTYLPCLLHPPPTGRDWSTLCRAQPNNLLWLPPHLTSCVASS